VIKRTSTRRPVVDVRRGVLLIGLIGAAALLLGAAGIAKLSRHAPYRSALAAAQIPVLQRWTGRSAARLAGLAELLLALVAVAIGGRLGAGLLAVAYLGLAAVSWRMMSVAAGSDCGCFGRSSAISHAHTAVNTMFAVIGVTGLFFPQPSLLDAVPAAPWSGIPLVLGTSLLAYLSYVLMAVYPELLRSRARLAESR
jgi:hypothetical protein